MSDDDFEANPPGYQPPPRFSTVNSGHHAIELTDMAKARSSRTSALNDDPYDVLAVDSDVTLLSTLPPAWSALLSQLPSQRPEAYDIVNEALAQDQLLMPEDFEDISNAVSTTMSRTRTIKAKIGTRKRRRTTIANLGEKDNRFLEGKEQLATTRGQAVRMSEKKSFRRETRIEILDAKLGVSSFVVWWAETQGALSRTWRNVKEFFLNLRLWNSGLKLLEGKHGAAVGAYFSFLRWCLYLNLLFALMYVGLVIIPYVIEHDMEGNSKSILKPAVDDSFSAGEEIVGLFTGGGSLNRSVYFLGSFNVPYKDKAVEPLSNYDSRLSFLFVGAAYIAIVFLLLIVNAVYHKYLAESDSQYEMAEIVFTSFDHSITDENSMKLKQISLAQLVRQTLYDAIATQEYANKDKKTLYIKRVIINIIVLAILAVSLYAIQVSAVKYSNSTGSLEGLIPAIILAAFNLILPIIFEILTIQEGWSTPLFVIQLSVLRSVVLRLVGLYVFFYTQFVRRLNFMCWESYVGHQVYNVFIVTFLIELVTSIIVDPIKVFLSKNTKWYNKVMKPARFQIIKNTLELVYTLALTWFGTFFSPLLPALCCFKIVVLYYCKKWSTLRFCLPPLRAFKATQSYRFLINSVCLLSLILVLIPLGYTIVKLPTSGAYMPGNDADRWIDKTLLGAVPCVTGDFTCADCLDNARVDSNTICYVSPAEGGQFYPTGVETTVGTFCAACPSGCGPFRNQKSIYETLTNEISDWPFAVRKSLFYIGSLPFVVCVAGLVAAVLFVERAKSKARRERIKKLRCEREMERIDKLYILQRYWIQLDGQK